MVDRGRISIKRKKGICSKGQEIEIRDYLASSQYANSRTWRTVEDSRTGY